MRRPLLTKKNLSLLTIATFVAIGIPTSASAESNSDTGTVSILLTIDGTPDEDGGGGGGDPVVCSPISSLTVPVTAEFITATGTFDGADVAITVEDKLGFWGYDLSTKISLTETDLFTRIDDGNNSLVGVSYPRDSYGSIEPDTNQDGEVDSEDQNVWLSNDRTTFETASFTVSYSVAYDVACTGSLPFLEASRSLIREQTLQAGATVEMLDTDLFFDEPSINPAFDQPVNPTGYPGMASAYLTSGSGLEKLLINPNLTSVIASGTKESGPVTTNLTAWVDVFGTTNQIKGKKYKTDFTFDLFIDTTSAGSAG